MKRKRKKNIYIALATLYSLMLISLFASELKVCISDDHIGVKSLESSCCDTSDNRDSYIENKDDCLDFPLLFSNNADQHISPNTKTIGYSFQQEKVPFNMNPFVDLRVIPKNQLRSSTIDKLAPTGVTAFLRALRTVSLLI